MGICVDITLRKSHRNSGELESGRKGPRKKYVLKISPKEIFDFIHRDSGVQFPSREGKQGRFMHLHLSN